MSIVWAAIITGAARSTGVIPVVLEVVVAASLPAKSTKSFPILLLV